jgi:hypothetical protein
LLLSKLPIIKNIRFNTPHINILDHVADVKLHKISHVFGYVDDVIKLPQRCPNITDLHLSTTSGDLSGLAALITLRTVTLAATDYATSNLNTVLTGIGPRLTKLTLDKMTNVILQDIVTLCQFLESLTLSKCTFLQLDPLDPQLPHFRNLAYLEIIHWNLQYENLNYIRHYVRLKTITIFDVNVFTVEFMREVVRNGTFANLEMFWVRENHPGALTLEALELLIHNCSHLKKIILRSCPLLNPNDIQELECRILAQNLDLQLITD